ncbi:MAG: autotransporter-associated beta strand repeat-containing protein [Planctomycetaceae bacterium]|nr:autotransporter-associated beta strand repeat-containing protein [Planctomycetaceae bacterium]
MSVLHRPHRRPRGVYRRPRLLQRTARGLLTWAVIGATSVAGTPLSAAETMWTAGSSTNFDWSEAANWSGGVPSAVADVVLPTPVPNPGALLDPQTLNLSSDALARSLLFADDYVLSGGSLSLVSGEARVLLGAAATIASTMTGNDGFVKRGDGSLRLAAIDNNYLGQTRIEGGVLSVLNASSLGADTLPIVVGGNLLRGVGGGQLVVGSENNNLDGLTWTRDLHLTGGGPTGDGNALVSVGNNTFTGLVATGGDPTGLSPVGGVPVTASGTNLASTFGLATITGGVTLGPSGQTTTFTGNGNWLVIGSIDGAGNLTKTGGGSLELKGTNTFTGIVVVNGGYLRVSSGLGLGTSTSTSGVDLQSGTLEIRTDTLDFDDRKVRVDNGGTIYVDHAPGGLMLNQAVRFAQLTIDATETIVINGRSGYGVTFGGNMANSNLAGDNTFNLAGNGLVTFEGNFWSNTNSTARTALFNGNGSALIMGSVRASNGDHNLTKRGSGTLTILGTASNFGGATNIEGGTLAITDFRSLNNDNSSAIKIGANGLSGANAGLPGTLEIIGHNLLPADVTTNKVVTLGGTTNGATILANQTGTSTGLTFMADVVVAADGDKSLTLGGANVLDNALLGVIPDSGAGATSLVKIGGGTWLLGGANTYTGSTTIVDGTLKLRANGGASTIVGDTSAITFGEIEGAAGGALEFVGAAGESHVEQLGALIASAGDAAVRLSPGLGGTASLAFASATLQNGAAVNFVVPNGGGTISVAGQTDGFWTARTTLNDADFGYLENGLLRAPLYDVDAGFVTAGAALADGMHNLVLGNANSAAVTIASLKVVGSQSLVQSGLLTIASGLDGAGGIVATGGSVGLTGVGVTTGGAGDLVIRVAGLTDVLTLSAPLTSSTTGGLTKTGVGTLIVDAVNDQTGVTNINAGVVQLTSAGRLSANSQVLNLRQAAVLDLNGQTTATGDSTASIGEFNGRGLVTNSSVDDATLVVGGGNGGGAYYGTVQDGLGRVSVTKLGTGAQTWTGLSTYTGATTLLSTGKVTVTTLADIGRASGIGAGDDASDATNAASLVFGGASSSSPAGLNYAGTASVSTNRLFTLAGTASNSGGSLIANGFNHAALIFSNTAPIAYAEGATGAKILNLDGGSQGDNRLNPRLVDNTNDGTSLHVYKNGTGLWILGNDANSYSGLTRLNRGTLRAYDGLSLPTASNLFFASTGSNTSVFESSGLFTRELGAGAGQVRWSASANGGFAAAEAKLTVELGNAGETLTWAAGDFVATTLVLNSTTALAEVEFVNGIDLAGATRTLRVDDNSTSGGDFATLSGVISGGAGSGLTKIGSGILQLIGRNTYTGDTLINGGTVRVVEFGSTTDTTSNFGAGTNVLTVGAGTTTSTLAYVGAGELSDRLIRIGGTTASVIFEASGSGPLVLTNVVNAATGSGTKTFYLRGDSSDANEIRSVLTDNSAGGRMNLTKDDNGTWILSGANTYSGTTTVSVGALGLGVDSTMSGGDVSSGPVGTGLLVVSNGSLFADGGDRVLDNVVRLNGATTMNVVGSYSLTLNGGLSIGATTSSTIPAITNSLPQGKLFTINSPTLTGPDTATRNIIFNGGGDTILNAAVSDSTAGGVVNLIYNGYGGLTLGGSNGPSTYSGDTTLSSGTLRIGVDEALPSGVGKGDLTINPAEGLTAVLDLNGHTQTLNGLVASSLGLTTIDNTSATPAHLIVGARDSAVAFVGGLANSGDGTLSLTKTGSETAIFSQGVFAHRGSTVVEGGVLRLAADVTATSSLEVVGAGSMLSLTGGLSGAGGIAAVRVGGGATLSLLDGAGARLLNLTTLDLGSIGTGTTTLRLNVGDLDAAGDGAQTDLLRLLNGGTLLLGNTVTFDLSDAGLNPGTTYTLLESLGGGLLAGSLAASDYLLGNAPGGFTSLSLNVTDNVVQLTTGTLVTGDLFWTGTVNAAWNADLANWSSSKGGSAAASLPGAGTNVVFQADSAVGGGELATTLEQNFRINSMRFEASTDPTDTPTAVTIAAGADPVYRLQIAPQAATDGILLAAGGPQNVEIAAPLKLGASQTWTVADAGAQLTISGPLSGEGTLLTSGTGTVSITSAASGTFALSEVVVQAGALAVGDLNALGNAALGNAAPITVEAGGLFYYSDSTAGNFLNDITLAGGTLSAAGANHTYGGHVSVVADSLISTRDAGTTPTTVRTIVLSGELSGAGGLTLQGNPAIAAGNSVTGTVVLMTANPNWTGGATIEQGAFDLRNELSLGTGPVTIHTGRILFKGATNSTWNMLAGGLTIDGATGNAVGELHSDSQGTAGQFTTNLVGDIALGGGGAAPILRLYQTDVSSNFRISGNVLLRADATIHSVGAATAYTGQENVVAGVISEAGPGFGLNVNSDTTWGQSRYQVLRLDGANTFSGGIFVRAGVLAYSTVSDNGGGPSNLGQGTDGISLQGGILRFVGTTDQTTNRAIKLLASSTLDASGENGAVITYRGDIDAASSASTLTLVGTGSGTISGKIVQSGTSTDLTVSSGTWTISGTANNFSDDVFVTGETSVLNLAATGTLNYGNTSSNGLYARAGGTINLLADDVSGVGASGGLDYILTDSGVGTFNTNTFRIATPRIDVGTSTLGNEGRFIGSGTIDVQYTGTTYSGGIRTFRGSISANLAGTASFLKQGLGEVVLSGNNSGLVGTVATRLDSGSLVLDFTGDNNSKLNVNAVLDLRGVTLRMIGNATVDSVQTVPSTTLGNGGASRLEIVPSADRSATLALGTIGRSNNSSDGTLRIVAPANGFVTSTTNNGSAGLLGASGYVTIEDGTGTYFAVNDQSVVDGDGNFVSGNIVALKYAAAKNDVAAWALGDHVTDDAAGFAGALAGANINSLRFNAAVGSTLTLEAGGGLNIASGGLLITGEVVGPTAILGGTIYTSTTELIITHDAVAQPLTISSWIRQSNALTKSGEGTLILNGTNTYEQETELQNGTLIAVGGHAVGDLSLVNLSDDHATMFQILDDETIGRLAGGNAAVGTEIGVVDFGVHTLTVNQTGSTTYAGVLQGTGRFVKQGVGNLALTGNTQSGFTGDLIVNEGLLYVGGSTGRLSGVAAFTINKSGAFMVDNNDNSSPNDRIADNAAFNLHSADGTFSGEFKPRGLTMRTDDNNSNETETIGLLTFGSGASYVSLETGTGSNSFTGYLAADWLRSGGATLSARGEQLGATSGPRTQFKIVDGDAEAAFITSGNLVGGSGTAGTPTRSIVPWAIGQSFGSANLSDSDMGDTFVTYVDDVGLVPLDLATDYRTFSSKTSIQDNIRESLANDLLGLIGQSINSLAVHNMNTAASTIQLLGGGAGQSLVNNTGAFLFTQNTASDASSSHNLILDGFDAGVLVGGDEYVFFVVNPNADESTTARLTAAIRSPLGSAADITKSGRGTLVLTGLNTAGGGTFATTINEGILEIADLDNIGGAAGELNFAGGTLRLAVGFSDGDLSTRAIVFQPGGGAIDDQGRDLTFAAGLGTGLGGYTKLGGGRLTLNAAADYLGSTQILGGSVYLNADDAIGRGDLTLADGTTLEIGSHSIDVGLVTLQGVGATLSGSGAVHASRGFVVESNAFLSAQLSGDGGFLKTTASEAYLVGMNSFSGTVEIRGGALYFNSVTPVGGGPSALGAPSSGEAGVIRMGLGSAVTELNYVGYGDTTDRVIGMQGGSSGSVTIVADGGGGLVLGGVTGLATGTKTLTLRGSSPYDNGVGRIVNGAAVINVLKDQTTTWELLEANAYTGTTWINQGTLRMRADQFLSGALYFGNANSVTTGGLLDLADVDASFGSMIVQINNFMEVARVNVTSGHTLELRGNVRIGSTAGGSLTQFSASGGGSFVVDNPNNNGLFEIGGNVSAGNRAIADFTGLSSFTVLLNPMNGTFRVNPASGTNVDGAYSTMYLPTMGAGDVMIRANVFAVGMGGQNNGSVGQLNSVFLGVGVNTIHANMINIGTGSRDVGSVAFQGPGSIIVRAADGVSPAAFNMGTSTGTTGITGALGNSFDVTGHDADLLFSTVTIGTQNRTNVLNNYFGFNQGTLVMESLMMSTKGSGGSTTTSTMDLGGGVVTIGAGSGAAVTLATNTGPGSAVAYLNIIGSQVSVTGDIVKGANSGTGTSAATLKLSGTTSVLDLNGFQIGSAAGTIAFIAEAGTLRNLAELNGGASFVKSGGAFDRLTLDTANAYTGSTEVNYGTLRVAHDQALGGAGAGTTVAQFAALELAGGIAVGPEALSIEGDGIFGAGALRNAFGDNSYAGAITITSAARINSDSNTLILSGGLSGEAVPLTFGGQGNVVIAGGNIGIGGGTLTKDGGGALSLNIVADYSGATTVASGTFNGDGALANSNLVVQGGATLSAGYDADGMNNNGVGALSAASAEWNDGARFVFDFAGVDSTTTSAGTDWDLLSITGSLTLDPSALYAVDVFAWTGADGVYGANAGAIESVFDPSAIVSDEVDDDSTDRYAYRWLWVEADSLTGITQEGVLQNFLVDSSGVFGDGAGYSAAPAGSFWVSSYGGNLYLNYSAVPEPGSLILIIFAGLGSALYQRRRLSNTLSNRCRMPKKSLK